MKRFLLMLTTLVIVLLIATSAYAQGPSVTKTPTRTPAPTDACWIPVDILTYFYVTLKSDFLQEEVKKQDL